MVSERCGLCGVQGSLLNQYPTVRPQYRDVPLSLKREEWLLSAAASLRVSCHFSCNQKTKNLFFKFHSSKQYITTGCVSNVFKCILCFSSSFLKFFFFYSFTFSFTVGPLLVCVIMLPCWPDSLEKHISISGDRPFQRKVKQKLSMHSVYY